MNEMIKPPQAFCERMMGLLGEAYDDFISSYEKERYYGLRHNPLKGTAEAFPDKMPFALTKVSWAQEGYYYQATRDRENMCSMRRGLIIFRSRLPWLW